MANVIEKISSKQLVHLALVAIEGGQEDIGICEYCGNQQSGVEPDAEEYECENESCGRAMVTGAEQVILIYGG